MYNVRNAGGISTADGSVIREGLLLSSAGLSKISERDELRQQGFNVIADQIFAQSGKWRKNETDCHLEYSNIGDNELPLRVMASHAIKIRRHSHTFQIRPIICLFAAPFHLFVDYRHPLLSEKQSFQLLIYIAVIISFQLD